MYSYFYSKYKLEIDFFPGWIFSFQSKVKRQKNYTKAYNKKIQLKEGGINLQSCQKYFKDSVS